MNHTRWLFALLIIIFILSACGRKGDLYMPNNTPEKKISDLSDSNKNTLNKPLKHH